MRDTGRALTDMGLTQAQENARLQRAVERHEAWEMVLEKRLASARHRLAMARHHLLSLAEGFHQAQEPSKAAAVKNLADLLGDPL
jgi:hypothetical protein